MRRGAAGVAVGGLAAALCAAATAAREAAGTPILFWRACGTGCGDIYVVRPGERERRVTRDSQAIEPAWTADRRAVVFASDRGRRGRYALYRLRLSDRRRVRLTRPGLAASDAMPTVGRDGAVAFVRTWPSRERSELMLLHGGKTRTLVRGRGLADPAWSPDGRRLAYTAIRSGTAHVLVLDFAAGRTRQMTAGGGAQPSWSPDGHRLVYVGDAGVYVHSLASRRVRRVVGGAGASSPDFSPDGRRVAFAAELSKGQARTALFVVDTDAGEPTQVTRPPALAHDVGADW